MEGSSRSTSGMRSLRALKRARIKRVLKHTMKLLEMLSSEDVLTIDLLNAFRHDYAEEFSSFNFTESELIALNDITLMFEFDTVEKINAKSNLKTYLLTSLKYLKLNHGKK